MADDNQSKVTEAALNDFFREIFQGDPKYCPQVTTLGINHATLSLTVGAEHLRPGGYISGPVQMAMADQAAYCAVFTRVGITPMAVTSNLSIDFLRPCIGKSITAKASLLKMGRSLAVMSIDIFGEDLDALVSRASVTFALPRDSHKG